MDFTKPRVAIYYDILPTTGFRNDGAPLFVHGNLRKLIDGVDILGAPEKMRDDSGNVAHLSAWNPTNHHGTFDLNILVDYGEDTLGIPLDWKLPSPNAYWAFDTHIDKKGYDYRLNRAKQFDHVFLCHGDYVKRFIEDGIDPAKIHYLPCAVEDTCYRPYPIMEKWDWCFIGFLHSEFRVDLIDRFIREFGLGDTGYFGWRIPQFRGHCVLDDTAKKFSQSRILLNTSINKDLNLRTFEAMACKQLLLTEDIPPIREMFEDGKHLVLFKTIDEAVEKARYYLAHPDERRAIAEAGYKEVIAKHTYDLRVREILKTCIGWKPEIKGETQCSSVS